MRAGVLAVTGLLCLVMLASVVSLLLSNLYCYYGPNGNLRCVRTTDFNGQVGFKATGIYTHAGDVFMLHSDRELFRLIFYCKNGTLITTTDMNPGLNGGYVFCQQTPLLDGSRISVTGTLITPSELNSTFTGDLYVFEFNLIG